MPKKLAVITDDELIPFWRNVEATLKARGMTMSEMVKKAGLNTTIYYKKRNNKLPDDDQQHKIALALRVCVGELRTGKSPGEPGAIEAYKDAEDKTCMNCGKAPLHDDCKRCKVGSREMWIPETCLNASESAENVSESEENVSESEENVSEVKENVGETVENVAEDDENYEIETVGPESDTEVPVKPEPVVFKETVEPETLYAEQVREELEEPKVNLVEAHKAIKEANTQQADPAVAYNTPFSFKSDPVKRLWAMKEVNSLLVGNGAQDAIEKLNALKRAADFYLDYLEGK